MSVASVTTSWQKRGLSVTRYSPATTLQEWFYCKMRRLCHQKSFDLLASLYINRPQTLRNIEAFELSGVAKNWYDLYSLLWRQCCDKNTSPSNKFLASLCTSVWSVKTWRLQNHSRERQILATEHVRKNVALTLGEVAAVIPGPEEGKVGSRSIMLRQHAAFPNGENGAIYVKIRFFTGSMTPFNPIHLFIV